MIRTLDDLAVAGTTVGVRVDVNSPVEDGRLTDDTRFSAHVDTLTELLSRGGRVAVLAHQGRPGGDDYITLADHADRFDELLPAPVGYVDCTFGAAAREAVRGLDDGEAVVLENTRFYAEEYMEFPPEMAADTHLVNGLVSVLDAYVNDAFAAAHRSQPSIVGFPRRLPAYAGRLMERELDAIGDVGETPSPRAYVLGGAKVTDAIDVAQGVLDRGLADEVLTTGVVANVLFMARGVDIGEESVAFVEESVGREQVDRARALLDDHGDRVHLPRDVAVDDDGTRREVAVEDLPPAGGDPILDIGSTTVGYYRSVLDRVHTVVLNGPAGVFERDAFATGTRALFEAASEVDHSIVGGGDTAAAIRRLGVEGFNHVSTGGGAAMRILSGGSLPAVDVLDSGDTNGD